MTKEPQLNAALADGHFEFRVRVPTSSWWSLERPALIVDGVLFSSEVPLKEADGLFVLKDPSEEFVRFEGPRLWYHNEPSWHAHYHHHPVGRHIVRALPMSSRAWYAHPDPHLRVPHLTTGNDFSKLRAGRSEPCAASCVANYGGRLWFSKRHIWQRNRMILQPQVKLYGPEASWRRFRRFPAVWKQGPPSNYCGPPAANHPTVEHVFFLSGHKVCVCLENICEPLYFTEKFVNAVRAGCIPVYHAHSTVRERFLKGASWVDPADHGFNPGRTIAYALRQSQAEFRRINDNWLDSGILGETTPQSFWNRIAGIMRERIRSRR